MSEARVMAQVAMGLGVDMQWLIVEEIPTSTWQQAESAARIARTRAFGSIALVTSPLHSYRALRTFRRAGLEVVSVPVGPDLDARLLAVGRDHLAGRLDVVVEALYEYVAIAAYRLRGRLGTLYRMSASTASIAALNCS